MMIRPQTLVASEDQGWEFSHDHFSQIAQFAKSAFGLNLSDTKRSLIYSRLTRRMKSLQYNDFSQYLDCLNGPRGMQEQTELLSVLTTNVTHFFREDHHFQTLKTVVLPDLITHAKAGGRVRLWSAGCSSGQEPYSMAMVVADLFPNAADYDFKILATDIDPVVVKKGETATYANAELEGLSPALQQKYCVPSDQVPGSLQIKSAIQQLVTFKTLNLVQPLPVSGPFDVIFCRNVTIYFDAETQAKVWGQLCSVLGCGGYLFIGHAERVSGAYTARMKKEGFTTMRKV